MLSKALRTYSLLIAMVSPIPANAATDVKPNPVEGANMSWEKSTLDQIIKADDLHIAPYRDDGVTYGTPTWIWCVEVDGELYVRAYNGVKSRWYQAAMKQREGKIVAASQTYEVGFAPVAGEINERIDAAYRAKYASSNYLQPMISERSREATVLILPKAKRSKAQ